MKHEQLALHANLKLTNWRNTKKYSYFRGSRLKLSEYIQRLYECEETAGTSYSANRLVTYRIAKWRARHKNHFIPTTQSIHVDVHKETCNE